MARVELGKSWVVEGDVEDVYLVLLNFLHKRHARIGEESEREIRFEQGSFFLTRLLGGWFVPAAWLPRAGAITLKQTKTGVRIVASIEESVGFGSLDPLLKTKYERFFEQWMDDLQGLFD